MRYFLENDLLMVEIESLGCELMSIKNKKTEREYLWDGKPSAWKRRAPVLFPLIGRLVDNEYIYDGKTYHMGQHGFARDMEFSLVNQSETELEMFITQTDETIKQYPFMFKLSIKYVLSGNRLEVVLNVENTDDKTMYFSIGGHPAFVSGDSVIGKGLLFESTKQNVIKYGLLNENGLLKDDIYDMNLINGQYIIDKTTFENDALIIENSQSDSVSIVDNGEKIVTVSFDAPVFGVWSANAEVPFVCIEPWYGRTDRVGYSKLLEQREWGQKLNKSETFNKSYMIKFF